jgi:hypothetical protein
MQPDRTGPGTYNPSNLTNDITHGGAYPKTSLAEIVTLTHSPFDYETLVLRPMVVDQSNDLNFYKGSMKIPFFHAYKLTSLALRTR